MSESKLKVEAVDAKLREVNGNLAVVGRHFGVNRSTVWRFVRKHPSLQAVMLDCREERIDLAESALDRAVQNGEGWAISLTLKTIGKSRGYVERTQVDVRETDAEIDRCIEQELAALAALAARRQTVPAAGPGPEEANGDVRQDRG
jgi:hypothetical protein